MQGGEAGHASHRASRFVLGWVGSDHDGRTVGELASWRCHATIREGEGVGRELARRLGIATQVEKRVGERDEARRGQACEDHDS